ncbi:MAG: creatininase family protein [Synechococcaceae cyanobacterium]
MPPSPSQRRLDQLPWPAVREQAARPGSTVIWPFGAIEQHGPHLPLGTDALFADRICEAVLQQLDPTLPVWRLPVQSLGFSPEHRGFPGTVSLGAELILALVQQVGADLAAAGFQRLVLFNAHGGQIGLLEAAARALRDHHPQLAVLPCFLWRGLEGFQALIDEPEASHGLHAGLAETSLMLYLAPELTGPSRQADGPDLAAIPAGWSLEGAAPCAWRTAELSASGVIGDPGGASAKLGEELFQRLLRGWERRFDALLRSDWPAEASPR